MNNLKHPALALIEYKDSMVINRNNLKASLKSFDEKIKEIDDLPKKFIEHIVLKDGMIRLRSVVLGYVGTMDKQIASIDKLIPFKIKVIHFFKKMIHG